MIHMKMLRRLLYILPVIGIMIASCVDIAVSYTHLTLPTN